MEGRRLNMVAVFMVVGIVALQMQSSYAQKTHTVGGSIGWTVPQNGANAYTTWAASETFSVGDVLVFNFATGGHTAAEVTKGAYDACTTANPITTWNTGPASVTLNSSGAHYYICTIPGHCSGGQKLAITVTGATAPAPTPTPATAPPTPTPTPPATAPPTPTPTPTPAATPPSASAPSPTGSPPSPSQASPPSPTGTSPPASGPGSSGNPSAPVPGVSTTTPPPPSSASFVAAAALPVTILSIAMALFY